jgi:spermidine synthase
MTKPWTTLDTAATPDGPLVLRHHEAMGYIIAHEGRVLMSSRSHASETALGALACAGLQQRPHARVLVGGLGMAITLRAVLDALPPSGTVRVAELNPVIVRWCRGPLAALTAGAVDDPRVSVELRDFAAVLGEARPASLDAIAIDLYVGPDGDARDDHPLYGRRATERAFAALKGGAVFAVWGEAYFASYERQLTRAGFTVVRENPARGNARAVVYVATKPAAPAPRG